MGFILSKRSEENLVQVHPKLVSVVLLALEISEQDFTVTEGLRTLARQKELYAKGASKTLHSKHLPQEDGFSHGVDMYPFYEGKVQVHAPLWRFRLISEAMEKAAREQGIKLTWGGNWKTLVDMPHYQIEVV